MLEIITLEAMLRAGEYKSVDTWLRTCIDAASEPQPAVLLGILTITFYGKPHLKEREAFLQYAQAILIKRLGAERTENLLKNRR